MSSLVIINWHAQFNYTPIKQTFDEIQELGTVSVLEMM